MSLNCTQEPSDSWKVESSDAPHSFVLRGLETVMLLGERDATICKASFTTLVM